MDTLKLFCLPFAGGNKYSYRQMVEKGIPGLEIVPLDLPGHGSRIEEEPLRDANLMANDIYDQIIDDVIKHPYAIYGHSMGSLLGYLVSKEISVNMLPLPRFLYFTGCVAPSKRENRDNLHNLSRLAFIEKLKELGGCPDEVLNNSTLMDFFEPVLKADFEAVETYQHEIAPPLDVPITIVTGEDENISQSEAEAWQFETIFPLKQYRMSGNHFFIYEHTQEILESIENELTFNHSFK